jgi:hypothetical protein
MGAIAGLFNIVPGIIWAAICAGLFGWGGINAYLVNSAQNDLAQFKATQAEAIVAAQKQAAEQTASLERTKDEAIKAAQTRAAENAAAAGRAKSELARMRESSAAGASNAVTSIAACSEYTATANTVLNECAGALVDLAEKADGHVNDIRTLTGSWPAWDKFASEMTDFTNRLKGNQ